MLDYFKLYWDAIKEDRHFPNESPLLRKIAEKLYNAYVTQNFDEETSLYWRLFVTCAYSSDDLKKQEEYNEKLLDELGFYRNPL